MKLSPEPDFNHEGRRIAVFELELRAGLKRLLTFYADSPGPVTRVYDKNRNPLGSLTPEWFLSLPRRDQLRFLSVAKRMHDTEASDVQTN